MKRGVHLMTTFETLYRTWMKHKATEFSTYNAFFEYLKTSHQIYILEKYANEIIDYLIEKGYYYTLDVLVSYIPHKIKPRFKDIKDYYMRAGHNFDGVVKYLPDEVTAHFDEIFLYYSKRPHSLDVICAFLPKLIIKNFDKVLEIYKRGNFGFSKLAEFIPDTIVDHFDEVFEIYKKNGYYDLDRVLDHIHDKVEDRFDMIFEYYRQTRHTFNFLVVYYPHKAREHGDTILNYYLGLEGGLHSIAPYIPDVIVKNFNKVVKHYKNCGLDLEFLISRLPQNYQEKITNVKQV